MGGSSKDWRAGGERSLGIYPLHFPMLSSLLDYGLAVAFFLQTTSQHSWLQLSLDTGNKHSHPFQSMSVNFFPLLFILKGFLIPFGSLNPTHNSVNSPSSKLLSFMPLSVPSLLLGH